MAKKSKKSESIKIGGIEIKDHRNVSFTTAFLVGLICFTVGALAYHYIFMILPQKPGCVQIAVRTPQGAPVVGSKIDIFIVTVIGEEIVASGKTGRGGKITFCEAAFEPSTEYKVIVYDSVGEQLWSGSFTTNERRTADFPVIVRQEAE